MLAPLVWKHLPRMKVMRRLTSLYQEILPQMWTLLVCSLLLLFSSKYWIRTEMCYLLKYVDKKENANKASNPWSIRHALIYQKSALETESNEYIFARLSDFLGETFRSLLSKTRAQIPPITSPHWTEIQALCFRSVINNWRSYINWIDQEVSVIVSLSHFSSK